MNIQLMYSKLSETQINLSKLLLIAVRNLFDQNFPKDLSANKGLIQIRYWIFNSANDYQLYGPLLRIDVNNGGITQAPGMGGFTADTYMYQLSDGSILNLPHETVHGLQFYYFGNYAYSVLPVFFIEGLAEDLAYNRSMRSPVMDQFIASHPAQSLAAIFSINSYGNTDQVYRWGWIGSEYFIVNADFSEKATLIKETQNNNVSGVTQVFDNFENKYRNAFPIWLAQLNTTMPRGLLPVKIAAPVFPGAPKLQEKLLIGSPHLRARRQVQWAHFLNQRALTVSSGAFSLKGRLSGLPLPSIKNFPITPYHAPRPAYEFIFKYIAEQGPYIREEMGFGLLNGMLRGVFDMMSHISHRKGMKALTLLLDVSLFFFMQSNVLGTMMMLTCFIALQASFLKFSNHLKEKGYSRLSQLALRSGGAVSVAPMVLASFRKPFYVGGYWLGRKGVEKGFEKLNQFKKINR
jgi:hypothetical protein